MKPQGLLTDRFVRRVRPDPVVRHYTDGRGAHGLSLRVQPNGFRHWYQHIKIDGRYTNLGLGGYPIVTLEEARAAAAANARLVAEGGDPRKTKRSAPTVAQILDALIARDSATWRNAERTARDWRNSLTKHAPAILRRRVDAVSSRHCISALTPLWNTKRETARKVKQRLSAVFKLAVAEGHREDNPIDAVDAALPKRRGAAQRAGNHRALPHGDVADALATVAGTDAWTGTRLAFRFLVLTAARNGEVRGATWDEMDVDAALWTIPATRMKAAVEHRVPLSDAALAVLSEARDIADASGLVFPSVTGRPISIGTLGKLLHENGVAAVPHGFRSSFRDWAAECTPFAREVMEAALAHQTTDAVEAAYLRSDLLERRRELMDRWAKYITRRDSRKAPAPVISSSDDGS